MFFYSVCLIRVDLKGIRFSRWLFSALFWLELKEFGPRESGDEISKSVCM